MLTNLFSDPQKIRQHMIKNNLLPFAKKNYTGKSLACIFLTRFCSTGCSFCYYTSKPAWRPRNIEDQFSDEGIEKFIEFSKKANLGYLLVSGGGEPLNQRKHVLELIEKISSDRIVLVTSGNWAKNYTAAYRYVQDMYEALCRRKSPCIVVLRISISEGHASKIGLEPARNLIKIFEENYSNLQNFKLQIKTFFEDTTLDKVLESMEGNYYKITDPVCNETDNRILVKKIPEQYSLKFGEQLKVVVGLSKIFHSTLRPNLNNVDNVQVGIEVFDQDLKDSEDYYPAVVFNTIGEAGLDWSINYNGDICTWQNQVRDNYMNLYEDSFENIMDATFSDPVTYSFIDKGCNYREEIVSEVNPLAVIRMKAIGLRDTSGTIIFEEEKTRLYMMIRVVQDYISDRKILAEDISRWDDLTQKIIKLSKEELKNYFKSSEHTIVTQQIAKPFIEEDWLDFLELIKLKNFDLSQLQIKMAHDYFNKKAKFPISNFEEINPIRPLINRRLTERLMHIKPLKRFQKKLKLAWKNMHDSLSELTKSKVIRKTADALIADIQLEKIAGTWGNLKYTGSYELDLMAWNDIDCYIEFNSTSDRENIFNQLVNALDSVKGMEKFKLINFDKNPKIGMPKGIYCGFVYHSEQYGLWKIDIWNLNSEDLIQNQLFINFIKSCLNDHLKSLILKWKFKLLNKSGRIPHLASYYLYQALLSENITDDENVISYLKYNGVNFLEDNNLSYE